MGPNDIPGEILKLGGEVMVPHLARLLDMTMNNNATPRDWKKAIVVPIHQRRDRPVVGNCRLITINQTRTFHSVQSRKYPVS